MLNVAVSPGVRGKVRGKVYNLSKVINQPVCLTRRWKHSSHSKSALIVHTTAFEKL